MTQSTTEVAPPSISARRDAWRWIPTLYFASGLPYVVVMMLATVFYKNLGVSNEDNTAYTSALLWPWVLKPLWSPLVDVISTQRRWILATQVLIALGLLAVGLAAPQQNFLMLTLAGFWLLAIASATHDIGADGFYMAALSKNDQSWFVGIRSTFYRVSMIAGSGVLVWLSGWLHEEQGFSLATAWSFVFYGVACFFGLVAVYHLFALPRPRAGKGGSPRTAADVMSEFGETFVSFFRKPGIAMSLAYLLIYRSSEALLIKMKAPFLLDPREKGGLGLDNQTLGVLDGTIGIALLTIGGILGGIIVARDGLRRWLFPMALCINLPNAAYLYLAAVQPESTFLIGAAIAVEQFGYGFGFAGYMLYMLHLARGSHQTAHYALCTGFMALSMMIPGYYSGALHAAFVEAFSVELGYRWFFTAVLAAIVPSLLITWFAPLREDEEEKQVSP